MSKKRKKVGSRQSKDVIRGETPEVRVANRVSILDFAEKNGFQVVEIDEKTATIQNHEDMIIDKINNSWVNGETNGNTIRFVSHILELEGKEGWLEAMDLLNSENDKYLSTVEYNEKNYPEIYEETSRKWKEESKKSSSTEVVKRNLVKEENIPEEKIQEEKMEPELREENQEIPKKFSKEQMKEIKLGVRSKVDIQRYNNILFSAEQMKEIRKGLETGIDVSSFSIKEMLPQQMEQIRLALQNNLAFNPKMLEVKSLQIFNADQLKEIRLGMEKGIDFKIYSNKDYSARQMEQLRKGLQDGLNVSIYANPFFDVKQMGQLRTQMLMQKILEKLKEYFSNLFENTKTFFKVMLISSQEQVVLEDKIEKKLVEMVEPVVEHLEKIEEMEKKEYSLEEKITFVKEEMDKQKEILEELKEQTKTLQTPIDYVIQSYDNLGIFTKEQMEEIKIGLNSGVNVSLFVGKEYNAGQMKEIRLGLENGIDISPYLNCIYSQKQMRELRLGIENKIDISQFQNPILSDAKMRFTRELLQNGLSIDKIEQLYETVLSFQNSEMEQVEFELEPN